MNIDLLFQIAGVGILIFAVNQVLQKAGREDIAVLASVAGLVVVMFLVVDLVAQLLVDRVERAVVLSVDDCQRLRGLVG